MTAPPTELRPIERVVERMQRDGLADDDIARRIGKKPRTVRMIAWVAAQRRAGDLPASTHATADESGDLRPLERALVAHRERGAHAADVASMFGRSPSHVERVLAYIDFKRTGRLELPPTADQPSDTH